jgi:hypothetical protein
MPVSEPTASHPVSILEANDTSSICGRRILAIANIKQHAKKSKPFFMDVNFMKMTNPPARIRCRRHLMTAFGTSRLTRSLKRPRKN